MCVCVCVLRYQTVALTHSQIAAERGPSRLKERFAHDKAEADRRCEKRKMRNPDAREGFGGDVDQERRSKTICETEMETETETEDGGDIG